MAWDEQKAIEEAEKFRQELENAPEQWVVIDWIRKLWESHYLVCGHKMLGRVLLGKEPRRGG